MRTLIMISLLLMLCRADTKKLPDAGKPLYTIMCTGQSIAAGTKSAPALSTTQPYNNFMLNGRYGGEGNGSDIIPLTQQRWELPSGAMANNITRNRPGTDIAMAVHAQNGAGYNQIKKETPLYEKGLSQVRNFDEFAQGEKRPHIIIAATLMHGESDDADGISKSEYKKYIIELQIDKQVDAQLITGQIESVPLFLCQSTSFTSDYLVNRATSGIPMAQLEASIESEDVFFVTSRYMLPYVEDGVHLTGHGSRLLGEYYAKIIHRVVFESEDCKPTMPTSVSLVDNIITMDYHIPRGKLVVDTTWMVKHDRYGFEFFGDTNTTIHGVNISKSNQIQIILSGIPEGKNLQVAYAHTAVAGAHSGPKNPNAIGGNIRDTDNVIGGSGIPLYNWHVQGIWNIKKE